MNEKKEKKNRCSLDRQVFFVYEFPGFFSNPVKCNPLQKTFRFWLILFNLKTLKSPSQYPTASTSYFYSKTNRTARYNIRK